MDDNVECPECGTEMSAPRFLQHIRERHEVNFNPMPTYSTVGANPIELNDLRYESGRELDMERQAVSQSSAEEIRPEFGEIRGYSVDEDGNKIPISEEEARNWAIETRERLEEKDADIEYMGVGRTSSQVQYSTNSPTLAAIAAVLIIAAIVAISIYFAAKQLYKLVQAGPAGKTVAVGLMLAVVGGGYLAYKAVSGS